MVNKITEKLLHLFITGLLHFAGKVCPDFIYALNKELKINNRTEQIINLRYIDKIKFEAIPDLLNYRCEIRQVFKIHKEYIDKLYQLVITYKRKS